MKNRDNYNPFTEQKITVKGLDFFPITMRHYTDWLDASPALTLRLSTLPQEIAALPWVSALFAMELSSVASGKQLGIFYRIAKIICISLRLDPDKIDNHIRFITNGEGLNCLAQIIIIPNPDDASSAVSFAPLEMNLVRQAIADLNGAELPDEGENTDLIDARKQMAEISSMHLEYDLLGLLDSVAAVCNCRISDMSDWTILEFEQRRKTADRILRFVVNGISEGSGASWKHGNPTPSWIFDRTEDKYMGFTPIGDFMQKVGSSESWLEEQISASSTKPQEADGPLSTPSKIITIG